MIMRAVAGLIFMIVLSCAVASVVPGPSTSLMVENGNWSDMTIYVLRSNSRLRVGFVPSQQRRYFELPYYYVASGEIRLVLDPLGSMYTYTTDPIVVSPGDAISFEIENHLPLSSWTVTPKLQRRKRVR